MYSLLPCLQKHKSKLEIGYRTVKIMKDRNGHTILLNTGFVFYRLEGIKILRISENWLLSSSLNDNVEKKNKKK